MRQAICAFANDLPGHAQPGVIFIGANDDGSCAHLDVDDALPLKLAQMRADGAIQPFPSVIAARDTGAEWVLVDLGPNLGAINRGALIAADSLVVPLTPDLFALQGLLNLGPRVREWRQQWQERRARGPLPESALPVGRIEPVGYVVMQHGERLARPVKAYERWARRVPSVYATSVVGQRADSPLDESQRLGLVKHYRSLMPMAQDVRKPMFALRPADGAIGAHAAALQDARATFRTLAQALAGRCGH